MTKIYFVKTPVFEPEIKNLTYYIRTHEVFDRRIGKYRS